MTERFETRQWVPFPVEQVFAFFATPVNLPRLMPPEMRTRIDEARLKPAPDMPACSELLFRNVDGGSSAVAGVDSEILISFCPFTWSRKRVQWTAQITDFVWNKYFRNEQLRGPFAEFRHRHGMSTEVRYGRPGTLLSDDIQYVLPYGLLGRLGDG